MRFAEAVLEELELEPGAAVFFHALTTCIAPRLVRDRAPDAVLTHFVHIPWPETDYWHVLPDPIRRALHDGLLANDVLGFHTPARWRLNFLRTASDLAGASGDFGERARLSRAALVCVTALGSRSTGGVRRARS